MGTPAAYDGKDTVPDSTALPTTMSPTFKFTKSNGFTRRVSFNTYPSWHELASKINQLYSIPIENVAVAYDDADGDEVTLSTQ